MKITRGTKFSIFLASLSLILFLFMIYFRAEIYAGMYKAPDDPYGISDIIEFLLGCLFLLLITISVVSALVLAVKGARQAKFASCGVVVFNLLLFLLHGPAHEWAANYARA